MLVAMATGTGKTFTLVNQIYRLMKSGVGRRVLFLVDRRALAAQAVRAFASFAEVLAAVGSGATPDAIVVKVARGREFLLDMIAALRRYPMLARTSVVVALEAPTRRAVLRCGALGLRQVIPAAAPPALLRKRLAGSAGSVA